jgi:hypothetical protein
MFRVEKKKTQTNIVIRVLKSRSREFARFQRELQALLRKHGVKRKR